MSDIHETNRFGFSPDAGVVGGTGAGTGAGAVASPGVGAGAGAAGGASGAGADAEEAQGGAQRSFVSRISGFEFAIATAALIVLEAILLLNLLVMPQKRAADQAATQLVGYQKALAELNINRTQAPEREKLLVDLKARVVELENTLPLALHNEDIAARIGGMAAENNIQIESITFAARETVSVQEYVRSIRGASGGEDGNNDSGAAAQSDGAAAEAAATGDGAGSALGAVADAYSALNDGTVVNADANIPQGNAMPATTTDTTVPLNVQQVQVNVVSEFHTIGAFLSALENGVPKARIRNVTLTREQEGVLKGTLNLEYASLSLTAEGWGEAAFTAPAAEPKGSVFEKFEGYVEDNVDPTILLVSAEDDIDPNFYIILNSSASNDTKVTYGVFPRTETEVYYNANNAVRAKLVISGDEEQMEYTWSLGGETRNETRRVDVREGKIRLDVISHPRENDQDKVAILVDVENNTQIPLEIRVRNDDVLSPRVNLGTTKGQVTLER